jgi:RNA polymerase sigma factor (TIGR02999 family)
MDNITACLALAREPGSGGLSAVFDLVYDELRALAGARARGAAPGATITTTALVHEAYLKLVQAQHLELTDRKHFFACAAQAMRQIVLDRARAAMAAKRGGPLEAVTLPTSLGSPVDPAQWIDLETALAELEQIAPDLREIVELRYFAGLSREEVAELLGQSVRTVHRNWRRARAFLHARLTAGPPEPYSPP